MVSDPPEMERMRSRVKGLMLHVLVVLCLVQLSSAGGYSCNCDCGPIGGGGRCSLLLPSVEYLKNGGTCQAIQLNKRTHHCIKHQQTEDETTCWSMPRTACMCREPAGHYNLMCECDGNRGIFCGSEQNNCVCAILKEDKNVAITIGIGVGSSVVGFFVLTFIITIIYFIRKYQKSKDPWYQFDKQFKRFTAMKERQKKLGIARPKKAARPFTATRGAPSSRPADTSLTSTQQQKVDVVIEQPDEPLLSALYATPSKSKSRSPTTTDGRRFSNTDPNWLLASKTNLLDISGDEVEQEGDLTLEQDPKLVEVLKVEDSNLGAASTEYQSAEPLLVEADINTESNLHAVDVEIPSTSTAAMYQSTLANEPGAKTESASTEYLSTLPVSDEFSVKPDSGVKQGAYESNIELDPSTSIYQSTLPKQPVAVESDITALRRGSKPFLSDDVASLERTDKQSSRKARRKSSTPGPRFYSSDSAVVHHAAFVNHGIDNGIYEAID